MLSLNERKNAAKSKRAVSSLHSITGREGWLAPAARLHGWLAKLERVRLLLNIKPAGASHPSRPVIALRLDMHAALNDSHVRWQLRYLKAERPQTRKG
jgi:hypothetical protein